MAVDIDYDRLSTAQQGRFLHWLDQAVRFLHDDAFAVQRSMTDVLLLAHQVDAFVPGTTPGPEVSAAVNTYEQIRNGLGADARSAPPIDVALGTWVRTQGGPAIERGDPTTFPALMARANTGLPFNDPLRNAIGQWATEWASHDAGTVETSASPIRSALQGLQTGQVHSPNEPQPTLRDLVAPSPMLRYERLAAFAQRRLDTLLGQAPLRPVSGDDSGIALAIAAAILALALKAKRRRR